MDAAPPPGLRVKDVVDAEDKLGMWYTARVVDALFPGDSRIANVTPVHVASKRGPTFKPKYSVRLDPVPLDSWVLIHFTGFNERYDEWLYYSVDGPVCISPRGASAGHCSCSRHSKASESKLKKKSSVAADSAAPSSRSAPLSAALSSASAGLPVASAAATGALEASVGANGSTKKRLGRPPKIRPSASPGASAEPSSAPMSAVVKQRRKSSGASSLAQGEDAAVEEESNGAAAAAGNDEGEAALRRSTRRVDSSALDASLDGGADALASSHRRTPTFEQASEARTKRARQDLEDPSVRANQGEGEELLRAGHLEGSSSSLPRAPPPPQQPGHLALDVAQAARDTASHDKPAPNVSFADPLVEPGLFDDDLNKDVLDLASALNDGSNGTAAPMAKAEGVRTRDRGRGPVSHPTTEGDDDDDDDEDDDGDNSFHDKQDDDDDYEDRPNSRDNDPSDVLPTPDSGDNGSVARGDSRMQVKLAEGQDNPDIIDPHRIMDLDRSGVPKSVVPVLALCDELQITREKLIRDQGLSEYSSALRYYMKGNNMARRSIIIGGARLIQWWDSYVEKRPPRSVQVDVEACVKMAGPSQFVSKNRKRDLAAAAAAPKIIVLAPPKPQSAKDQHKRNRHSASRAESTPSSRPPKSTSHSASSSRRSLSGGGDAHWGSHPGVKLLPALGKWEATMSPYEGFAPFRIGLFDSSDDAADAVSVAGSAVQRVIGLKKTATAGATPASWCGKCERSGEVHEMRVCILCLRALHFECLPAADATTNAGGEWMCPPCTVELRNAAVTAAGGRSEAMPSLFGTSRTRQSASGGGSAIAAPKRKLSARLRDQHTTMAAAVAAATLDLPKLSPAEQLFLVPVPVDGDIEWVGAPFSAPPGRVNRCAYYTKFKRQSTGEVFSLLDHVLIARTRDGDDEEEEYDFFVGQIEAMWQDLKTGERSVRLAWFFWPEEVNSSAAEPEHLGRGVELLSSAETDLEPCSRVVAKVSVLTWAEFQARGLDPSAQMPEEVVAQEMPGLCDQGFLACQRCGMWGFYSSPELTAHNMRYCGDDTPEILQTRRAQQGRPVATGSSVPRPPTRVVEPVRLLRKGLDPKLDAMLSRAKNRAAFGPLFVRQHYHQRSSKVRDVGSDDGRNPWQASLLFADLAHPEVEAKWAPLKPLTGGEMWSPEVDDVPDARCGFCHKRLALSDPFISCATCTGLNICLSCVRLGRQGAWNIHATGCHRVSHSYRVPKPRLSMLSPTPQVMAELSKLFEEVGVGQAEYQVVEVLRSNSESEPPSRPRFRFGVKCSSLSGGLIADDWAWSVEDAKAKAAATALNTYFGVGHSRTTSILSRQWSQLEVGRLVEGMQQFSLAWEHVARVVGTKDAIECRNFFASHILPACEQHNLIAPDEAYKAVLRDDLENLAVAASRVAIDDAVQWAKRVQDWHPRDSPFAVLGDSSVRLPTKFTPQPGAVCNTCKQSGSDLMCDGCGRMFHRTCVNTAPEWVCDQCLDDERYVYEHYAWGPAGATLCRLARVFGEGQVGEEVLKQWELNDQIVEKAASEALEAAMHNDTVMDQHQMGLVASRNTVEKQLKRLKQQREAEQHRHALDLMGVPIDESTEALIQRGTFDFEEWKRKEWASRHFCEPIVSALETANRGLALALATVIKERNELADTLRLLESKGQGELIKALVAGASDASVSKAPSASVASGILASGAAAPGPVGGAAAPLLVAESGVET